VERLGLTVGKLAQKGREVLTGSEHLSEEVAGGGRGRSLGGGFVIIFAVFSLVEGGELAVVVVGEEVDSA